MRFNFEEYGRNRNNQFGKLGLWYILALSTIATIIIVGQGLIQDHLNDQLNDSRVINVAGRQRMLSQKITKLSLLIQHNHGDSSRHMEELASTLDLWQNSHEGLKAGDEILKLPGDNSPAIDSMFSEIQTHFDIIARNASNLVSTVNGSSIGIQDSLNSYVDQILAQEAIFLNGMDQIVNQYDIEAREKVRSLSRMEYGLLSISLLVILLEVLFIFRPTTQHVNKTVKQLISSEKNANKMAKEISAIYSSLEKSYEQIARVNEPDEIPKLWAKADQGGNLTSITETYQQLSNVRYKKRLRICDLFPGSGLGDDFMDDLVEVVSEGENWSGQLEVVTKQIHLWADITVCPIIGKENSVVELLILGTDISSRKQAEQDMNQKNRNEIEKRINQQKYRSVLILEGQEEERKRLAMDIHDGIGQLLSALKFQIEGIDPNNKQDYGQKLTEIKSQLNDTIKEVRRITFNLKPTVLGDYGLSAGLKVFVNEISKYSEVDISFSNIKEINDRYSQRIENNVFRIVQEAINNAIKYAEASKISVLLDKTQDQIVLRVQDDGVGFDISELQRKDSESGSGFFNMYERTEYVSGQLEIDSAPGQGTKVELHVPIKQLVNT